MKTLLAAVDFSDISETVANEAVRLAQALEAQVVLVHVAEPKPDFVGYEVGPESVRDTIAQGLQNEHRRLHELKEAVQAEGVPLRALLVQGAPAEKILGEQLRLDADLIVLGSHGHGALAHLLTGSTAQEVLRHAGCPVLVVPSRLARPRPAPPAADPRD